MFGIGLGCSRPRQNGAREISEAGERRDDADARDRAPYEVAVHERRDERLRQREEVAVPEGRPGRDDEHQAGPDEVGRDEQTEEEADDRGPAEISRASYQTAWGA